MRLMLVVGARPQIIKSAPIIREAQKHGEIELQLVHTGQHYDFEMSKVFFDEMALPEPLVNLGVGSGSHAWQTGNMMIELEKTMIAHRSDLVMVPGDTNSTLAGAIVAAKLHLPVAHVEAGARSHDMKMPEEVNRRLADHSSSLLFAPTRNCAKNLGSEGFPKKAVKVSGDSMYDALLQHVSAASRNDILKKLGLRSEEYAALTLHRPENVDDSRILGRVVKAIMSVKLMTVFPVHPRTKQRLKATGLLARIQENAHIKLTDPLGYHEMLQLTKHSRMVFTDSGGLQKEAFWLHTPCVTLRERTEWIETTASHANILVGSSPEKISKAVARIMETPGIKMKLKKIKNPFGDGHASQRIISEILKSG
jgi:UDP-N-acetylglucosamine 2-epimerase (non-hydrolysing)